MNQKYWNLLCAPYLSLPSNRLVDLETEGGVQHVRSKAERAQQPAVSSLSAQAIYDQRGFLKGEIQRGRRMTHCHTVVEVAFRLCKETVSLLLCIQFSRRIPNDGIDGIVSRSKYSVSPVSSNMGSSKLVNESPIWRQSLHSTQGGPVMGSAAGSQSSRCGLYKFSAMKTKAGLAGRKGGSLFNPLTIESEVN